VGSFAFPGIDTQVQGFSVLCESTVWDRFAFSGIDTQVQGLSVLCESTVWDHLLSLV
jgi:hypothetical protein